MVMSWAMAFCLVLGTSKPKEALGYADRKTILAKQVPLSILKKQNPCI